ncbi:hypothetical protein EVAR_8439_1 [Eumeta japonica]|uniref:Uncharacterized protein n=1 Tax=Eumeta variegata TaxID=151549 RepID=A0A4C1WCM6_EUMVA|nr:hypothetical protein EVAR_8439_1 [Eumeta japonica]
MKGQNSMSKGSSSVCVKILALFLGSLQGGAPNVGGQGPSLNEVVCSANGTIIKPILIQKSIRSSAPRVEFQVRDSETRTSASTFPAPYLPGSISNKGHYVRPVTPSPRVKCNKERTDNAAQRYIDRIVEKSGWRPRKVVSASCRGLFGGLNGRIVYADKGAGGPSITHVLMRLRHNPLATPTLLKITTARPRKLRATDRTLHRTCHRLATVFFALRFDSRVRPPAGASTVKYTRDENARPRHYELVKKPLDSSTRGAAGTHQKQTEKIIVLSSLAILAPHRVYALCLGTGGTAVFTALLANKELKHNFDDKI